MHIIIKIIIIIHTCAGYKISKVLKTHLPFIEVSYWILVTSLHLSSILYVTVRLVVGLLRLGYSCCELSPEGAEFTDLNCEGSGNMRRQWRRKLSAITNSLSFYYWDCAHFIYFYSFVFFLYHQRYVVWIFRSEDCVHAENVHFSPT